METRRISLLDRSGRQHELLLDAADVAFLQQYTWRVCARGYAHRKSKNEFIYLHRLIMASQPGQQVDHINGNRLDNRRENLRTCTHAENMHNQLLSSRNTSGFKGVSKIAGRNRWRAAIRHNGQLHYLGNADDPRVAAHLYNRAAVILHGEFARLNPL